MSPISRLFAILPLALFLLAPAIASAEEEEKRFYFGTDFGFSTGSSLTSSDADNDVGTRCDRHLDTNSSDTDSNTDNIDDNDGTYITSYYDNAANCLEGDTWEVNHSSKLGRFGSVYSGYVWPDYNLRGEVEYRWLATGYDDDENITLTGDSDPKNQEITSSRAGFSEVRSQALFFNGYYDYTPPGAEKWSFFGGVGLGWASVSVRKSLTFSRNPDNTCGSDCYPDDAALTSFPAAAAGTTTHGAADASDDIFRLQLLGGATYKMTPRAKLRLKLRYDLGLNDFSSSGHAYDTLRGHESSYATDKPVRFGFETEDLNHLILSVGLSFDI